MTENLFIWAEDAAIKAKLSGITVADGSNVARPVDVKFRLPETALENATFPMIVINPAGITRATDREHRGTIGLPYYPDTFPANVSANTVDSEGNAVTFDPADDVTDSPFINDFPIPFNFDYSVTVYTRSEQHMVQVVRALATQTYLPFRFGFIQVGSTVRTLDLIGGPAPVPDRDSDGKRVFRTEYIVRVFSELTPQKYIQVVDPNIDPDEPDVTAVPRIESVAASLKDFTEQGWNA